MIDFVDFVLPLLSVICRKYSSSTDSKISAEIVLSVISIRSLSSADKLLMFVIHSITVCSKTFSPQTSDWCRVLVVKFSCQYVVELTVFNNAAYSIRLIAGFTMLQYLYVLLQHLLIKNEFLMHNLG